MIEQITPAGQQHPFAQVMLAHFQKLNSPLRSIGKYPTLASQIVRFHKSGWKFVTACDLNEAWRKLVSDADKDYIDSVEPFDEYEEFVLFGQHYLLLTAKVVASLEGPATALDTFGANRVDIGTSFLLNGLGSHEVDFLPLNGSNSKRKTTGRKFSAACGINEETIICFGGLDNRCRLSTAQILKSAPGSKFLPLSPQGGVPSARMCHSFTQLGNGQALMVGGREGPRNPLSDCWLYSQIGWERVQDLPCGGRYRHCSASFIVDGEPCVIISGGKGVGNSLHPSWLIWRQHVGWQPLDTDVGLSPEPRFSANMVCFLGSKSGFVGGGFNARGSICSDIWSWKYESDHILFERWEVPEHICGLIARAGAQTTAISEETAVIVGGVCNNTNLAGGSILVVNHRSREIRSREISWGSDAVPQLLVGFSCVLRGNQLLIIGGGAVIFRYVLVFRRLIHLHRYSCTTTDSV